MSRYNYFKKKFGSILKERINDERLEAITYSIMIYEDFNRPRIVRWLENMKFRLTKKPHTLGVMQVYSKKAITDRESVILGIQKINSSYQKYISANPQLSGAKIDPLISFSTIIMDYNGGSSYQEEVSTLASKIITKFYPTALSK